MPTDQDSGFEWEKSRNLTNKHNSMQSQSKIENGTEIQHSQYAMLQNHNIFC